MKQKFILSIITLLLVAASVFLAKQYLFPAYKLQSVSAQTISSSSGSLKRLPIKSSDISDKIKNIQDQLKYVNIKNLPQPVQGILHQIQNLSTQPLHNIKNTCMQICSKL